MTNSLAYYDTKLITAVRCFIVQAPDVNVVKLFSLSMKLWTYQLEC
jgi:hypothetical protein